MKKRFRSSKFAMHLIVSVIMKNLFEFANQFYDVTIVGTLDEKFLIFQAIVTLWRKNRTRNFERSMKTAEFNRRDCSESYSWKKFFNSETLQNVYNFPE